MASDPADLVSGSRGPWRLLSALLIAPVLGWLVFKPIAVFVYGLSHVANRLSFDRRAELARLVAEARRAGRPILFASNHVSMFDDPVVPMALFRMGLRSIVDTLLLALFVVALIALDRSALPVGGPWLTAVGGVAVSGALGAFGARKTWWSLGDLVNFSGAAALRAKLESSGRSPGLAARALLAVADPLIHAFMRSSIVKTIFVDRRPGDEAKTLRARAGEAATATAARGEAVWVFIEGGRSREPDEIRPARRGIGEMIRRLVASGADPLVVVVHQRGMEHVMPIGARSWFSAGHSIDVRWAIFEVRDVDDATDPQELADGTRVALVRLQAEFVEARRREGGT